MRRFLHLNLLVIAVLAGLGGALLHSTAGLQLILGSLPGQLQVRVVEGSLFGGFTLQGLNYRVEGHEMEASHIELAWHPWALLLNRVEIKSLNLGDISLVLPESTITQEEEEGTFAVPVWPWQFAIEQLQLASLTVTDPADAGPLQIGPVRLAAELHGTQLQISRLSITHPLCLLEIEGRIGLEDAYEHAVTGRWDCELAETGGFAGSAEIAGDTTESLSTVSLSAPLKADITFEINDLLTAPSWSAASALPQFNPADYRDFPINQDFVLHLTANGTLDNAQLQGELTTDGAAGGPILVLDAGFEVSLDQIRSGTPAIAGALAWQHMLLQQPDQARMLELVDGAVKFERQGENWNIDAATGFDAGDGWRGGLRLGGVIEPDVLRIDTLALNLAEGRVDGKLLVADYPGTPVWTVDLGWDRLLLPTTGESPVQLTNGSFTSNGRAEDYRLQLNTAIGLDNLPSAGLEISAAGNVQGMSIDTVLLQLPGGSIQGSGALDWSDGISASLRMAGAGLNPGIWWEEWPGELGMNGEMTFSRRGDEISVQLERFDMQGQLREHPVELALSAGYRSGEILIRNASFGSATTKMTMQGSLGTTNHLKWDLVSPDLSRLHPQLAGEVAAQGIFTGSSQIPSLSASFSANELETPWLSISQARADIQIGEQIDVRMQLEQLTGSGRSIDQLQLDVDGALAAHTWRLEMGHADTGLVATGEAAYGDARWHTTLDHLTVAGVDTQTAWSSEQAQRWNAELQLSGLDGLPDKATEVQVDAALSLRLDDLGFLDSFTLPITDIRGHLDMDLALHGALTAPELSGRLLLDESAFIVPELGVAVDSVRLDARPLGADTYRFEGSAVSGGGSLSMQTDIGITDDNEQVLETALRGERFEIIHAPEVRAFASPDIRVTMSGERARVSGRILIPEAEVNLDEFRDSVTLSGDVVLSDTVMTEEEQIPVDTAITIEFGDRITITGQGLSGRLSGSIDVYSNERGELLGNGEIAILEGRFSAYGQSLQIEQGRLIFTNSRLDNPELRVTATRRIDDTISAGIRISGYATSPVITLFSTPAMADDEILAYIVFGRPLNALTSGEGTDLIGAATSMGLQNTGFLTSRISSTFGLDQFGFSSDAGGQNASVVIGKYLTPKLYISYVMGLFERMATAQIRYDLNRNWSLEVKSSTDIGVDLYYNLQK